MKAKLMQTICRAGGAGLLLLAPSCVHVSSDPIEVKPIHIVADINLRVDRELDQFFAFQDKYPAPSTQAATQAAATQAADVVQK